jgi:hypothetical protein
MEPLEGKMKETSSSATVSTKLERIAKLAQCMRDKPLTTLAHHIDLQWLREAYRRTRKDGATGVDGQTAEQYAADLEGNLQRLLRDSSRRFARHKPRATASRRLVRCFPIAGFPSRQVP